MTKFLGLLVSFIKQTFLVLVFLVLIRFTYAYFFQVPYAGFDFSNGEIVDVYLETSQTGLEVGDTLVQIGTVSWDDFAADVWQMFFEDVEPGQTVSIIVQRNGEQVKVDWLFPGFTQVEFLSRFYTAWWLCYAFWLCGAFTYLFIRPRDTRWQLLIAFNFLTALWLSVGSGPSHWHVGDSALILKAAIWLCLPVYWHLHWIFPKPFGRWPSFILWSVYAVGCSMVLLEFFQIPPPNLHLFAFLLAITGSMLLLIIHAIFQPEQWRSIRFLLSIAILVILPIVVIGVTSLFGGDLRFVSLVLLGLPLIPGAYIYAIYRHQFGALEIRANRLITLYLYLIIIGSAVVIFDSILGTIFNFPAIAMPITVVTAMLIAILTTSYFLTFERFVERRVLGITLPPDALLETYAAQIVTKLDKIGLVQLLKNQVLPSLLVRQSAIIYWEKNRPRSVLFTLGIDKEELPTAHAIPELVAQADTYMPAPASEEKPTNYSWIRLCLLLNLGDKPMGIWLLGRRDPDDVYSQREIPTLQALAAQTAVALTNILQAENLHKLYQANIDRNESERNLLALELHDDILSQMTLLAIYIDEENVAPQYFTVYEELISRFRQTIRGLRPAMLNYGLRTALEDLVEQLFDRVGDTLTVKFSIAPSDVRYPINVEQHVFRIVQQATENALQHASPSTLCISGSLTPDSIVLTVEDNGVGFPAGEALDFATLLANRHFGLVGMHERAALIGAEMELDSALNQGTRITIRWTAKKQGS